MSVSKIKINTNSLNADAGSVAESIAAIESSIQQLKNEYAAIDSMWDGPASEVFKAVYTDDIGELEENVRELRKLNGFENNARVKYDNCENRVGSIVASVK